jgi:hypothetical protein
MKMTEGGDWRRAVKDSREIDSRKNPRGHAKKVAISVLIGLVASVVGPLLMVLILALVAQWVITH